LERLSVGGLQRRTKQGEARLTSGSHTDEKKVLTLHDLEKKKKRERKKAQGKYGSLVRGHGRGTRGLFRAEGDGQKKGKKQKTTVSPGHQSKKDRATRSLQKKTLGDKTKLPGKRVKLK